ILEENGVIRQDRRFFYLARFFQLSQHLKAGEYLFLPGQTPHEVLRMLRDGATMVWPVTIPEGSSIYQVADILAAGKWGTREEVLRLVRDQEVLARYGIAAGSLEGYLFPDTFHLIRGQGLAEIIGLMVERGRRVREELGDLRQNELGLSPHEVLTLASIVEKETAVPEERPLIARVFINRLRQNMRLQTDPTVIYGIENFNGNITKSDLQRPTPYNTYVINGLPPGPIANPGRAAIEAVLKPTSSSCLYFVSKNDGSHHFSRTLEEHNRAVARYQRRK
ncbi:MAG: endolytic transglycosylase MltG, partial [Desulfobulbaceae bacterium]|nr:endolytic transglycosylase MltG [Desulfobulbaceae bacterium]